MYKYNWNATDKPHKCECFTLIPLARQSAFYIGYYKAEQQSHILTKWFTLFVVLFFTFGTIFCSLLLSFWNLYNGNVDTVTWWIPYNTHIFFIDKSSFFGWYFELLLQALSGYAFVLAMTCTVTFFGGCSFYIEACRLQLKSMFDDMIQKKGSNSIKQLSQTVVFHNTIFK